MPSSSPISSVNDFVVRFANVNGSGSASANEMFARAVLRMGVPCTPRNIFPSNIQGLPTWYEVRISEAGHLGARGGTDLMVAMNPQTWDKDVASIEPGGYLFYDNTKPMPASKFRDDINVIGVPLTAICNREYTDPRQRQLFKNIIYLGALSALLDMDVAEIEKLIGEQYKTKEKLLDANKHALHLGRDWATMNLECPIGLKLRRADAVGDRIFLEGNAAAALGAVYGGATVCAWYPITPSSSVADAFTSYCQAAARRSGNQEEPRRHRAGRRRTRLDRHRHRRRLERRARLHGDLRSRHLADAGVPRPRLFRRNPRGGVRRAALRPLDRHADAHPAVRHPQLRLRLARRHQARPAAAGGPDRGVRIRRPGVRSRRPPAGAGLRHARSRDRHELPALPPAQVGRQQEVRPRQGDDRSRPRIRARISAAISMSTATASRTAPIRARIRARAHSSPAAPRATAMRATPRKARPTRTTCSGCCASSRPRRTWCRAPSGATPTSRRNTA